MNGSPDSFGIIQGKVQGVLADHANRCHSDLNAAAAIVTIGEHQITANTITGYDVVLRQFCKQPNLSTILQASGSLEANTLIQQFIRKSKCLMVLDDLVPIRKTPSNR